MTGQPALNIRTFLPADFAQVQELFASGLMEFAGEYEDGVRRYVDQALKDDLADIPAHYLSHPRSNFWVVESGGPAVGPRVGIVGIVGIQPREREQDAELRRMSVSSSVRRQGIGRRLLETTEEFCREKGYRRIFLSTVEILQPALAMYRRFGYTTVREEPYGDPPNRTMIVHHLVKELDTAA
ncbi:MAG: GNAT family N-acetyltransferase [Chloroflexi bacterium]|nr:GNAT family N-acetyltransferase [Chloroflexota bacterium]